jgi:endonuclease-3
VARKPKCWNCLIADLCEFRDKTPAPAGVLDPAVAAANAAT